MIPTTEAPALSGPFAGVHLYGLIGLIVFYVILLLIGLWAGRQGSRKHVHANTEQVILADRSFGWIVGSITLTATWVGGGYINGSAEVVATPGYGLVWCQAPVCYSISLVLGGIFFAKKMRAAGYVTMLDPFSKRFGNRMGGLLFLPALTAETLWSAAVLSALGSCLQVILGLDMVVSIVASACVAVLYTIVGGLYSVAYTDVAQLALIPIGLWLSFPFAINHEAVTDLAFTKNDWLGTYDVAWTGNYLDSALLMTFGGIPWQAYLQRILGSKTPNTARLTSIIAGFGCFIMVIPAVLIGAVARSTDWNQTSYTGPIPLDEYRMVLPMVLQYLCPAWVSFIGLGAVSAAVMSSADSSVLSASSMFARNVWKLVFRPKASETEIVWVLRITVFFVGALGALLAITVQSVYSLFILCSDLVYVILFPQLTMVLYNETTNTYGSICAFIVGLLFRILGGDNILGLPPAIIYPFFDEASQTQLFPFKTLAMLMSFVTLFIVSYLTKFMFSSGCIPLNYDIFECFSEEDEKQEVGLSDLAPTENVPVDEKVRYAE